MTTPHVKSLLAALRQRASVVARLANHLPRGAYLRQLSYWLVMGKFSHALAAVARPRLERKDNASVIWSKIQVAFNDVARSITGARRRDHITIKDLLDLAGIESANKMVVKAIAAETWSCYHSNDKKDGAQNHVGSILFTNNKTATAKTTRSARTGQITVPLQGGDSFVTHAANVWNWSVMLRVAPTKAAAKKAASDLASLSPLQSRSCGILPPACGSWGVYCGTWGVSQGTQQTSPSRALLLSPPQAAGKGRRKSASASPSARNKQGFTWLCLLLHQRRMSRSIRPSVSKGKEPRRGSVRTAEKLCVTKRR
jgi:hypothetical protein